MNDVSVNRVNYLQLWRILKQTSLVVALKDNRAVGPKAVITIAI